MPGINIGEKMDKGAILNDVLKIFKDLTSEFDTDFSGALGPEIRVTADLGFESVDVVEMIVALEEYYKRRDLPFQELVMDGGRYHDFTIGVLVDFLYKHLTARKEGL